MGKRSGMGLILDREQLCQSVGVSDSAITAWEKKGMPVVRKGRGRGMKSLYDLDAVRTWCAQTGYGHGVQALLASFSRTEPLPAPTIPVQTFAPAPPAPALDPYDDEALRVHHAFEFALLSLPAILEDAGVGSAVDSVLAGIFDAMERELRRRAEPDDFIARELDIWRSMLAEERADPGSWTA